MSAVKELIASKDFWQPLLASIPDFATILDRDARILYVNRIESSLRADQVIGVAAFEFIVPEDHDLFRRELEAVFRAGQPRSFEIRGGRPGFPVVPFEERLSPIWDGKDVVAVACIATNIAKRRDAEERAQRSEEQFLRTFDYARDGILFVDSSMRILRTNEAFARMLGYSREEIEGRLTIRDITSPEYSDRDRQIAARLLSEGGSHVFQKEYIRRDGARVPVELSVWTVAGQDGKPAGFHSIVRDLSEQLKTEHAVRQNVSLLRSTLEATADGILVVDSEGRIVSFNQRFAEMWRLPDEILQRREDAAALQHALRLVVDPDAFHERVRWLYSRPQSESFDVIELRDGRVFERTSRPHLLDGKPIGRVWGFRDITERRTAEIERRRSEETLSSVFESCPDGIAFASMDGTFVRMNAAFLQMTGYSREELVGKRRYADITPPEYADTSAAGVARLLEGEGLVEYEKEYIRKDGTRVPVRLSAYLVRDVNGRPVGTNAFARDLTDVRKAQAARRRHAAVVQLMQSVSSAANLATSSAEAMRVCLSEICAFTGWPVGHVYLIPEDGRSLAEPSSIWHVSDPERYDRFVGATMTRLVPKGDGLPGRVWAEGRPVWIPSFPEDGSIVRRAAAKECGIGPALGFPVLVKDRVTAVLEFFTDRETPPEPDEELLGALTALGTQLGRAIERERAQRELSEREELLRLLMAGVRDYAIFMLDPQGRIVSWNEGAQRIFGLSEREAVGRQLASLSPPKERSEIEAFLRVAMEDGRAEAEGWRLGRAGARFWANVVLTALRDENGALRGFANVTRDITERKKMEREVLEAGAREQRRIAQDLHDSLGQQLTGVALLSQVLHKRLCGRDAAEAPEAGKIARHAADAVRQARELAQGLLPTELDAGLPDALRALGHYAREALGVECDVRCDRGVAAPDDLATAHLYRITQEAINNAVRHGRARRIAVRLARADHRLLLTVEDDGIGIPSGRRRRTGLGLGIMQYRARMMGASLQVTRGKERGTIVQCSCPLH